MATVGRAADALAELRRCARGACHYDLAILDKRLPYLDGLEATRIIRAQEQKRPVQGSAEMPRIPVLALTADVLPENRAHCVAVGMDGFLTKPVRKEQLREALARWLQRPELVTT